MSSKYSPTIIYERRLNKNNQNNLTNKQNSKLRKSQPQEDVKENNSITIITNKYYLDTNEIANLKNNQNPKCQTTNNIKQAKNKSTNQKNNKFLSIEEYPEMADEDLICDNLNYMQIIRRSMAERPDSNPYKIKSVDANKYLNNDNCSISTFNDLKKKLLNRKNKFNTPFVFYKNNIDYQNFKKVEDEKNYQIKRYRYLKAYRYSFNPVVRRENAMIIQNWWVNKIHPKIDKRNKVIQLQSVFRGYITRKSLNDIICISVVYQNFINKLRKILRNFVRKHYFPKRYYKKKYAFEKIFPLKLKLFFRKWKNINQLHKDQVKSMGVMFNTRKKNRYVLLALKTYVHIWKLKCEQYNKIEEKNKEMRNQRLKLRALPIIFNLIEKASKRAAYDLCKNNISEHLRDSYQNKFGKNVLEIYKKHNINIFIKHYFELWKNQVRREKEKQLKLQYLANEIKNQLKNNDKQFLRNSYNNLRSNSNLQNINDLKRAKSLYIFPEAIKHINTCVRKNVIRLKLKEYIRKRNIEKQLIKIIERKMKKKCIKKWNAKIKAILYKENRDLCLKKLINKYGRLYDEINKAKYFNRWRKKASNKKYKEDKIVIYNNFCDSLKRYVSIKNKKLFQKKNYFFERKLKKFINVKGDIIQKRLKKCLNNYIYRDNTLRKRKALNKWRKFLEFWRLTDLKAKNLETVSKLTKNIYDAKKLSKNINQWKEKNTIMNLKDDFKFKNDTRNIFEILILMREDRLRYFYQCLRTAKDRLMKQMIVKNLVKEYTKFKISYYFHKYKVKAIKFQNKYKIENITKLNKLKHVTKNKIKKQEKINYGFLKKYLYKWNLISKLINEENFSSFLMNIKKACNLIKFIMANNALRIPFDKISNCNINRHNVILKRLRKYFIKNDAINKTKAFHVFMKKAKYHSKNIMKSNIIYNLKLKYEQIRNRTLLSKYFHKWKMINGLYIKQRNNNGGFLAKIVIGIYEKIMKQNFLNELIEIRYAYYLYYYSDRLFKMYNNFEKITKTKYSKRWKDKAKRLTVFLKRIQKGYYTLNRLFNKVFSYKRLKEVVVPTLVQKYKKKYAKDFLMNLKQVYCSRLHLNYYVSYNNYQKSNSSTINFKFKSGAKPNYPIYDNKNEDNNKDIVNYKAIEEKQKGGDQMLSKNKIPKLFYNKRISNYNKDEEQKSRNITIEKGTDEKKDTYYNERLIPYLVNYLNELRQKRLRLVLNSINYIRKINLFWEMTQSWIAKKIYADKDNFMKTLKFQRFKIKLFIIIRRSIIDKLVKEYLTETKKRNDLFILMYKMKVYKKYNFKRKVLRYIKIWRHYTKFMKDRADKLEKFEQNFNQTYEKLTDSVFVDKGGEKSVQTQVLSFLNKINLNEKNKFVKKPVISKSSLNSFFSGKMKNNDKLNNSNNFTFNNINNNENSLTAKRYSFNIQNTDAKSLNNSQNLTSRKIRASAFINKTKNKK